MSEIKKLLADEVELVLPKNFSANIHNQVMSKILKSEIQTANLAPKASFSEFKDNLHLAIGVIFCTILIYFLGFNKSYQLTISVSKELVFSFLSKTTCGMMVVYFIINEHFDRKKKVLI